MEVRTTSAILRLSKSRRSSNDFDSFLESALKTLCEEINVSTSSFWYHDSTNRTYSCIRLYNQESSKFEAQTKEIKGFVYHELVPVLQTNDLLHQSDVKNNEWSIPNLEEMIDVESRAWLALPLFIKDKQLGFLFVTNRNKRIFDIEDQNVLCAIGLLISESYRDDFKASPERGMGEIVKIGENTLEDLIFYTSHDLRHPITNMLSLTDLANQFKDMDEVEEILSMLKIEILKLDDVIQVMIAKMKQDERKK